MNITIDYAWITISCPLCELENSCQIQQVELEEQVLCRGCHETIKLVDGDSGTLIAKRQIDSALDDLQKAFKKLK